MAAEQWLFAASYDLSIHRFDLSTGQEGVALEGYNSQTNRIVILPAERRLWAATYTHILMYDFDHKHKYSQSIPAHENNVTDLCVTQETVVSCGEDKLIKLWDRRTLDAVVSIAAGDCLNTMALLPSGHEVLVGGESGQIGVWDTSSSKNVFKVSAAESPVRSVALGPDGHTAIVAFMSGLTASFRVDGDGITENYRIQAHNDTQLKCAVAPSGRVFATSAADNKVKLWNLETGALLREMTPSDEREWIFDIVFTADSAHLCAGGSDGVCRLWDVENGRIVRECTGTPDTSTFWSLSADGTAYPVRGPRTVSIAATATMLGVELRRIGGRQLLRARLLLCVSMSTTRWRQGIETYMSKTIFSNFTRITQIQVSCALGVPVEGLVLNEILLSRRPDYFRLQSGGEALVSLHGLLPW